MPAARMRAKAATNCAPRSSGWFEPGAIASRKRKEAEAAHRPREAAGYDSNWTKSAAAAAGQCSYNGGSGCSGNGISIGTSSNSHLLPSPGGAPGGNTGGGRSDGGAIAQSGCKRGSSDVNCRGMFIKIDSRVDKYASALAADKVGSGDQRTARNNQGISSHATINEMHGELDYAAKRRNLGDCTGGGVNRTDSNCAKDPKCTAAAFSAAMRPAGTSERGGVGSGDEIRWQIWPAVTNGVGSIQSEDGCLYGSAVHFSQKSDIQQGGARASTAAVVTGSWAAHNAARHGSAAAVNSVAGTSIGGSAGGREDVRDASAQMHRGSSAPEKCPTETVNSEGLGVYTPTAAAIIGAMTPGAEDKRHIQCRFCTQWGHERYECPVLFGRAMRRPMPGFDIQGEKLRDAWIGQSRDSISAETAMAWLALQQQNICNATRPSTSNTEGSNAAPSQTHASSCVSQSARAENFSHCAGGADVAERAVCVAAPWAAEAAEAVAVAVPVSESDPRVRLFPIVQGIPYVEPSRPPQPRAPEARLPSANTSQRSAAPADAAAMDHSTQSTAGAVWTSSSGKGGLGISLGHSSAFSPSPARQAIPDALPTVKSVAASDGASCVSAANSRHDASWPSVARDSSQTRESKARAGGTESSESSQNESSQICGPESVYPQSLGPESSQNDTKCNKEQIPTLCPAPAANNIPEDKSGSSGMGGGWLAPVAVRIGAMSGGEAAALPQERPVAISDCDRFRGVVLRGEAYDAQLPAEGDSIESLGGRFPTARLAARAYDLSLLRRAAAASANKGGYLPGAPPAGIVQQLNFPADANCMWEVMQALSAVIQSAEPDPAAPGAPAAPEAVRSMGESPTQSPEALSAGQAPLPSGPAVESCAGAGRCADGAPGGGAVHGPGNSGEGSEMDESGGNAKPQPQQILESVREGGMARVRVEVGSGGFLTTDIDADFVENLKKSQDSAGSLQMLDYLGKLLREHVLPRSKEAVEQLIQAGAEEGDCPEGPMQAAAEALAACGWWISKVDITVHVCRVAETERWFQAQRCARSLGKAAAEVKELLLLVRAQAAAVQQARSRSEADTREWLMGGCCETVHQVWLRACGSGLRFTN